MNTIERLKLTNQLKKVIDERNAESSTIKKLKLANQVQDLRKQLGLVGGRGDMPTEPEQNIENGKKAMQEVITEKKDVKHAMYRDDIGWIDFLWGDVGTVRPNGKTKGGKGISHIVEARMRKDGATEQQALDFVKNSIVSTLALGQSEVTSDKGISTKVMVSYNGTIVHLVKNETENAWVLTGYEDYQKVEQVGGATNPDLHTISPIRSRTNVGAFDDENIPSTADNFNRKIIKGRKNSVKTAKGTKIDTVFALVDSQYVIASHTETGAENPKYPQELQPRDRSRDNSIAWVTKTANNLDPESLGRTSRADTGSPIVGDDLIVESGNGRTMAIKLAYKTGKAEEYVQWLKDEADMFGFTAEQVEQYKQPILVRIRTSEVDRATFAIEANQDDKLSLTATERAKADAKRLNDNLMELFNPSDDGDILASSNLPFIRGFLATLGDTEASQYTDSNGKPTQALVARIKACIFAKAYDDDRLLEMMADVANPELQNMLNALSKSAPKFIEARVTAKGDTQDLSEKVVDSIEIALDQKLKNAIVDATNLILNAKRDNQALSEYVKQQSLFGDIEPETVELALFLAQNARSAKKMSEYLSAMAEYIAQDNVSRQNFDMFGEPEPLNLKDVMKFANQKLGYASDLANENQDNQQPSSIDSIKQSRSEKFNLALDKVQQIASQYRYDIEFGNFNDTLRNHFDSINNTAEYDIIAIVRKDNHAGRIAINNDGLIIGYVDVVGDVLAGETAISYQNDNDVRDLIISVIIIDKQRKQRAEREKAINNNLNPVVIETGNFYEIRQAGGQDMQDYYAQFGDFIVSIDMAKAINLDKKWDKSQMHVRTFHSLDEAKSYVDKYTSLLSKHKTKSERWKGKYGNAAMVLYGVTTSGSPRYKIYYYEKNVFAETLASNPVQAINYDKVSEPMNEPVNQYSTDISAYTAKHNDLYTAVHEFFKDNLKGKVIKSSIGNVHILGSSWQKKLKQNVHIDEIKAKAIPFIPQILMQGHYEGRTVKNKVRKDDYIAFHAFGKEIQIDDNNVFVRLLVGERENNQYEFVVYSLYPNKQAMLDAMKNPTMVASENAEIMLGYENILSDDDDDVNMLDDISDGKNGWNIEIVSITPINEPQPTAYSQADILNAIKNHKDFKSKFLAIIDPSLKKDVFHDIVRDVFSKNRNSNLAMYKDFIQNQSKIIDELYRNFTGDNMNEPTNQATQSTAYNQSDIDYLNSIIKKTIDLETVDMDYIIEIGEKDEHDPLFEQALQVISDYEDEMTKDI